MSGVVITAFQPFLFVFGWVTEAYLRMSGFLMFLPHVVFVGFMGW